MNLKKLFTFNLTGLVIFILLSMMAAACAPARAAFTGSCLPESEPPSPDVRTWSTDDSLTHIRDDIGKFTCTVSDARLKGDVQFTTNYDGVYSESSGLPSFVGHWYGLFTIKSAEQADFWEGGYYGYSNKNGYMENLVTLYGRGKYEGQKAQFKVTNVAGEQTYNIVGEGITNIDSTRK